MMDLHTHILPGVDDGAQNEKEMLEMLQAASLAGVTELVATPHVRRPDFDMRNFALPLEKLREAAAGYHIRCFLGCECNLSAIDPSNLQKTKRFCTDGTNALLLELPFDFWPSTWERVIYDLQAEGFRIRIAHPERLAPVQRNRDLIFRMTDMDCEFVLSADSIFAPSFSKRKILSEFFFRNDLPVYLASDAHQARDYVLYAKACKKHLEIF